MKDGEPRELRIPARDSFELAASLCEPSAEEPQDTVLTYDDRGIGGSRPPSLAGFVAYLHQRGEQDLAGVIDWISARFPGARLLVVGHSVGGQIVGLAGNNTHIQALLAVAAQSGDWRLWPFPTRCRMALLWYGLVPTLTRLFG